jgi:hypothetical protein
MTKTDQVKEMLKHWGCYYSRSLDAGTGWSNKASLPDGMPINKSGMSFSPDIDVNDWAVEQAVCALRLVDEVMYEVIMLHYVHTLVTVANRLQHFGWKTEKPYYVRLRYCVDFIGAYIDAKPKTVIALVNIPAKKLTVDKNADANFYSRVTRTSTVG